MLYIALLNKSLVKYNERLYVLENATIKKKLISKNHDDSLTRHFEIKKTLKLIQKKYYWSTLTKQTRVYVKTCNIYQRTKVSCHRSYDELKFLFVFTKSWKEIIMNFITSLSANKRREVVYDSILMIIDRCIKMMK